MTSAWLNQGFLSVRAAVNGGYPNLNQTKGKKMPQPDKELILKRYRKGLDRLSRFYAEFDEAEAFYEGDWEPGGPEGFPQTVPATASSIVDEATDHIDTDNITPHVPTIGKTQQSEKSAGKPKDSTIG